MPPPTIATSQVVEAERVATTRAAGSLVVRAEVQSMVGGSPLVPNPSHLESTRYTYFRFQDQLYPSVLKSTTHVHVLLQ